MKNKIPEDWEEKNVQTVCEILDSKRVPLNSDERYDIQGNIPYYGANGVVDHINKFIFNEDLILIAEDGGNFDDYQNRPIAYKISGKSWVNNHAHILRVLKNYDFNYIFYSLEHKNIIPIIKGGTRSKLNQAELKLIPIPCPKSKKEQEKISSILLNIDNTIQKTKQLIEKNKMMKDGLMKDLFTEGVDENGKPHNEFIDSKIGKIPREWTLKNLDELKILMTNGFVGIATPYYTEKDDGVLYLYGNNIRPNKIELIEPIRVTREFHSSQKKSQLQEGDLLTVQSGHIGTTAVVTSDLGEANCHALIITRIKKNLVNPFYISYYCNSLIGMQRMNSIFVGSTIKHVNVKEFKEYLIPMPKDIEEQTRIVTILKSIGHKIEAEENYLNKLIQIKTGLMKDLLSGEVPVKGC